MLHPLQKINSRYITDLHISHKTVKLLEDNIGENLDDLADGEDYVDTIPKAGVIKEITDNLDFIKIKNFRSVKDNIKKMRTQATNWEKIFAKDTYDKKLLSKIYEELLKLNNKKTSNPI